MKPQGEVGGYTLFRLQGATVRSVYHTSASSILVSVTRLSLQTSDQTQLRQETRAGVSLKDGVSDPSTSDHRGFLLLDLSLWVVGGGRGSTCFSERLKQSSVSEAQLMPRVRVKGQGSGSNSCRENRTGPFHHVSDIQILFLGRRIFVVNKA